MIKQTAEAQAGQCQGCIQSTAVNEVTLVADNGKSHQFVHYW